MRTDTGVVSRHCCKALDRLWPSRIRVAAAVRQVRASSPSRPLAISIAAALQQDTQRAVEARQLVEKQPFMQAGQALQQTPRQLPDTRLPSRHQAERNAGA